MKKIHFFTILIAFLICISFTNKTQNTEWTVNSSTIKFKIKNAGFNVDGSFTGLTAKISFEADKAFGNSIDATINTNTINTGNGTRDKHLKKDEYFGVEKFPTIGLKCNLFSKIKDGNFNGFFTLTIKGISKSVTIPFTYTEKDGKANFKGSFTINRLDYKVGTSSMVLSNNVTMILDVNATKK